jgi:hypothetical protein
VNIDQYEKEFLERLEQMTAEELSHIFEDIFDLKQADNEENLLVQLAHNKTHDNTTKSLYQKFIDSKIVSVINNTDRVAIPFSKIDKRYDFKASVYKQPVQYITKTAS